MSPEWTQLEPRRPYFKVIETVSAVPGVNSVFFATDPLMVVGGVGGVVGGPDGGTLAEASALTPSAAVPVEGTSTT